MRIKPSNQVPKTRAEAEELLGRVREKTIQENQLKAERDRRVAEIDAEFNPLFESVKAEMTVMVIALESWADDNASEFGEKKSIECLHGKMGWRTGNPTLKPATGRKWEPVIAGLLAMGDAFKRFIRTTHEVNKEAILAERKTLSPADLSKIGVKIVQGDGFFVEPETSEAK